MLKIHTTGVTGIVRKQKNKRIKALNLLVSKTTQEKKGEDGKRSLGDTSPGTPCALVKALNLHPGCRAADQKL